MTLLDAPNYDPAKAKKRRNLLIAAVSICVLLAGLTWYFWNWPQEHLVNQFFSTVEAGDLPKAFAIWNHDPDWQKHTDRYKTYPYGRFELDWGHASEWGDIKSHKIVMSKTTGSGVVVGVDVNGQKTPVFLWVERKNKTLGFSPVELSTE
ncbi:MAG TPA: hypothetical protein VGM27_21765 [Acidobacteriaceae bacterium]|jgi:hypothetical protein